MSLPAGSQIGHYVIVERIGAGAMGEVYRARDPKLRREVALKVLPAEVAGDRERRARFEREAHVLASLNHPNIASILGLAEFGADRALVLELVEGVTLEERLASGPMDLDEALDVARQIAEALEAAHERGIVHRDLKPANIKVAPQQTVKILDFGIAKIVQPGEAGIDEAATVTATAPGVVIGTPAYMSPEQARGAVISDRSDIWAFGAILFEMLAGRRAFAGDTSSDVIAAILRGSPDFSALPSSTPPGISRLIRRCLERDPKSRLHHIGDARLDIEDALRDARSGPPAAATPAATTPPGLRGFAVAVAIAIPLLALGAYLAQQGGEIQPREIRLQLSPPPGTRFVSVPAVSPDGTHVVFGAVAEAGGTARLWLRPFGEASARELPGTDNPQFPFWSADSRSIGFFADGQVKRMLMTGGNPVAICPAPAGRGGLWLDDDTIVFAATGASALSRVNAAGGLPAPFTTLTADEVSHRFPSRLPGRQLLFYSVKRTPEQSGIRLVAIDAPDRVVASVQARGAGEYVNGFLVFVPWAVGGPSPVLAQRLSLPAGDLIGQPTEIGQTRISETLGRQLISTAPAGVIATLGPLDAVGQYTWIARDGRALDRVGVPGKQLGVELSPDRQQLATVRSDILWTMDLARPVPVRLGADGQHRHPVWSPDGRQLLLMDQGRGVGAFELVTAAVRSGESTTVVQGSSIVKPVGWMRDGRLVWIAAGPTGSAQASIRTMAPGGRPEDVVADHASFIFEARVSPDERWIAYSSNRSGRFEIEVSSFPTPGRRYPVSTEGGGFPRWRADGRELFYLSADSRLMAVPFTAGAAPTIGTPVPLFEARLIAHPDRGTFAEYEYHVNPDGSQFLINQLMVPPDSSMTVIVNWNSGAPSAP